MKKKVAIFIDWDNFRKELEAVTRYTKTSKEQFDFNKNSMLLKLIRNFIDDSEELYRIFIYTAPPLKQNDIEKELIKRKISDEDLDKVKEHYQQNKLKYDTIFNKAKNFIDTIALEEYVALRKGILKVGSVCDGKVTINQKQVDMLIGLDIAQLSYENRVDKIIVLSKDTDMKPAIKVARINGIHTVIGCFEEYQAGIPRELKEHVDTIRQKSFIQFVSEINKLNIKLS